MTILMIDADGDINKNLIKLINKQISNFDKAVYINNIITCSRGILQNDAFIVLLDHKKDFMSIKNLKILI